MAMLLVNMFDDNYHRSGCAGGAVRHQCAAQLIGMLLLSDLPRVELTYNSFSDRSFAEQDIEVGYNVRHREISR